MTNIPECLPPLWRAGISEDDAVDLRRIAMTLHRWHEMECGDAAGNAIERDDATGNPFMTWDMGQNGKRGRTAISDREAGAMKRLKKIMARYPTLGFYIQSDPRGASLYILRPGDVPEGAAVESYYSRGLAVYK